MIGSKIYWVYCDYSLLEAPWSTLLDMLDLLICKKGHEAVGMTQSGLAGLNFFVTGHRDLMGLTGGYTNET